MVSNYLPYPLFAQPLAALGWSFGTRDSEERQLRNMDKEIMRRNGNDSIHCDICVWLKESNLQECSVSIQQVNQTTYEYVKL